MSQEHETPTKPMDPLFKIEKLTIELDETTTAVEFFQSILRLMSNIKPGRKRRFTIFVQAEEVEEES